jgi:hypothetical protein
MFTARCEWIVTYYRLYFFSRPGGSIVRVIEIEVDSDELAQVAAEGLRDGSPMELWQSDRLVWRLELDA